MSAQTKELKPVENPAAARAASGWVDNHTVQSAAQPLQGHFVTVTDGEHKGRYGVYVDNGEWDEKTGQPKTIIVSANDDNQGERLVVKYGDAVRDVAGKR